MAVCRDDKPADSYKPIGEHIFDRQPIANSQPIENFYSPYSQP